LALFEQKEPLPGIVFWPQNGGYYYHTKREEEPASVLNGTIHKIDLFLFDSRNFFDKTNFYAKFVHIVF
jgi:hypothetical protein